jgi:ABC-type Mn2+/Zn2+ transport system permease subunit
MKEAQTSRSRFKQILFMTLLLSAGTAALGLLFSFKRRTAKEPASIIQTRRMIE